MKLHFFATLASLLIAVASVGANHVYVKSRSNLRCDGYFPQISADGKKLVYVTLNTASEAIDFTVNVPVNAKLTACYRTSDTLTIEPSDDIMTQRGLITVKMPALSIATMLFDLK